MAAATAASALLLILLGFSWAVSVAANGAHHVVGGSSAAPSPTSTTIDCSSSLVSLADCLTFVEEGSKEKKPQGQCCPGLKKVVKEQVACLCQAFKGSADYGVKLNITKALTLPSACGVKTPPFSKCNIGAPGSALLSPALAPSASPSIFGQSIARVPAPSPANSMAASLVFPSLVVILFAAAAPLFSIRL